MKITFMCKLTICLLLAMTVAVGSYSQSLKNTVWKSYFNSPISDTAILSIGTDSLSLTNSHGLLVVRSVIRVSKDTIELNDVAGRNKCQLTDTGKYSFTLSAGKLIMRVLDDPCDGRANAIAERVWSPK